jgi:hypothetical protein
MRRRKKLPEFPGGVTLDQRSWSEGPSLKEPAGAAGQFLDSVKQQAKNQTNSFLKHPSTEKF